MLRRLFPKLVWQIRRWQHRRMCPKCWTTALATNEVYDEDFNQTGWEWDCSFCHFHWREYQGQREWLDMVNKEWKPIIVGGEWK